MTPPSRNLPAEVPPVAPSRAGRRLAAVGVPIALALASVFASSNASAQATGFTANRYEPAEQGSDWFENDSLDIRGGFRPALGLTAEYAKDNVDLRAADDSIQQRLVADQIFLHVGAALIFANRFRIGLSLPLALYQFGEGGPGQLVPPGAAAIGDLRVGADIRLFGEYGDAITMAVGAQVWLPTGRADEFTGDGKVRVQPHLSIAGDLADIAYAIRLGYETRGISDPIAGGYALGNELVGNFAIGGRIADKRLLLGPEFNIYSLATNAFHSQTTPAELLLGAHYRAGDFKISAGVGAGVTEAYGSPGFRAILGLDWIPAIEKPVPPPADRDGDGILDKDDACPDTPGVRTEDPKTNGCPPPPPPAPSDRDGDGILDKDDACPDVPGVATDDPKTNGCPSDRDHDGIIDKEDACPDVPGVKTDDPKTNGCPPADPDRDHDGILNDVDACPDEAGPANPDPKKNGCPLAFVKEGLIQITEQVKFETGSARILKDSDNLLGAVLKVLADHNEIKLVRVEGHTDNTGSAALNKTLSGQRAAAVVAWLTLHGVDKARLKSEGFGSERPIDSNATPAGKANNRRVEFHIDKSDAAGAAAPAVAPATEPKKP
jgi:OOP family OmpA-OmpF porin